MSFHFLSSNSSLSHKFFSFSFRSQTILPFAKMATYLHTHHWIEFRLFHLQMHKFSIFERTQTNKKKQKKIFIQQVRLRDVNVFRHCWFRAILCCQYGRRRGHENCENAKWIVHSIRRGKFNSKTFSSEIKIILNRKIFSFRYSWPIRNGYRTYIRLLSNFLIIFFLSNVLFIYMIVRIRKGK